MNDATPEEWRPVPGYEGFYEVSSLGRVRSLDREFIRADGRRQVRLGRMLSPTPAGRGYPSVQLRFGRRRPVHVLVCEAFHGPRPSPSHEAAHGNGNLTDNNASNLHWATPSENQQDSIRHGTKVAPPAIGAGELNGNHRLTLEQVIAMRAEYAVGGTTLVRLAEKFGIGKSQVHNIVSGKRWTVRQEWKP